MWWNEGFECTQDGARAKFSQTCQRKHMGVCFFFSRAFFLWRAWHFNFTGKLWMEREKCTNLNRKKSLMNTFWKMMGLRIKAKFFSFFKRFVHGYHAWNQSQKWRHASFSRMSFDHAASWACLIEVICLSYMLPVRSSSLTHLAPYGELKLQNRCLIALRTRPQTKNTPLRGRLFFKKRRLSYFEHFCQNLAE